MNNNDSPYDAVKLLAAQYHYDIGLLASIIVMQALKPSNTPAGIANLIETAGKKNPLFKTSVIRGIVEALREQAGDAQEQSGP